MVLANRTPPGSQRSTWVERGHARRLGRRESASAYWFCTSCGRALYAIKKASGFRFPARVCRRLVPESIAFMMAKPRSLRRGAKPSGGDIADSEGFAVRVRSN